MQSLGSGFIIDPSGLIVTNNHVIEGADEITVTLQDNTSLKAKVLGRDETGDIALVAGETGQAACPRCQFGDSDAERVGDWVIGHRQSIRAGRNRDGRYRLGARPRHPPGSVR